VLSLEAGQTRELAVAAKTASGSDDLRYEWVIGGRSPEVTMSPRFSIPEDLPPGEYSIRVTAIERQGSRSAPQTWRVSVRTLKPSPPVVAPKPAAPQLTVSDVQEWLSRMKGALERRDVAALRDLGVIRPGQEAALGKALEAYKELRVSIQNPQIQTEGDGGTVSFDRKDTDETGKELKYPRQTFRLERRAGGAVAVGRVK
jgi:hypothetical protein